MAAKKQKRKLTEHWWAIRVGTVANSDPYYLLAVYRNESMGPRLFRSRRQAHEFKQKYAWSADAVRDWAIVRVSLTER